MSKDEVLLLISIMSLLGSAYVMKKFAPLLKGQTTSTAKGTESSVKDEAKWIQDAAYKAQEIPTGHGEI